MVLSMIVQVVPCGGAGAAQSCRVALGPQARDAVVLLSVLQILRRDAAH